MHLEFDSEDGLWIFMALVGYGIMDVLLIIFVRFVWPKPAWTFWDCAGFFVVAGLVCSLTILISYRMSDVMSYMEWCEGTWTIEEVRKDAVFVGRTDIRMCPKRNIKPKHFHHHITWDLPNDSPLLERIKEGDDITFTRVARFYFRRPKTIEDVYRVTAAEGI